MKIYADNAATTQLSEDALQAMQHCLTDVYGNASSIHSKGRQAEALLSKARQTVARCINAQPNEIYFTSGGTEADNWAIQAIAEAGAAKGMRHIISSTFEHHAVLHTLEALEKKGFEITLLDVHSDGLVRPDELEAAIRDDTVLVTIMFANNEIGTIQPVQEIGAICHARGVLFHTDAVQAVGHVEVDVQRQNIDLLSLSAHKFHGPKGVGALYCRKGVALPVFIHGGAQERGKRGGTENVPGIVGMAAALEEATNEMVAASDRLSKLRDRLVDELSRIPRSILNGHPHKRLPGIVNFCFEGIEGEALLLMLDHEGICASSGSACTSGSLDPSHVLLALGLPHEIAHGSLRLSLSDYTTGAEVEHIISSLSPIIEKLRDMSPMWERIQKGA